MIEQSEQMKSATESKAANLADKLGPLYPCGEPSGFCTHTECSPGSVGADGGTFPVPLKLAMPLAVLSAMAEASQSRITVKGGKFLEAAAAADTIVFDKTGTLTHACPKVARVIPFGGKDEAEMLRLAACLEEHFPHSMANARGGGGQAPGAFAKREYHSKVEYIVAHGIVSAVGGERVLIGSAHFVPWRTNIAASRKENRNGFTSCRQNIPTSIWPSVASWPL